MDDIDDRDTAELERRLSAYAAARLTPHPASVAPMRAAVIAAMARATAARFGGGLGDARASGPADGVPARAEGGGLGGVTRRASLRTAGRSGLRSLAGTREDATESVPAAIDRHLHAWDGIASIEADRAAAAPTRAAAAAGVRRAELFPVDDEPQTRRRGPWLRRAGALLLAAGLVLGSVAVVSAAPPDSPLYGARLWIENLTLPASASARAEARVAALQQRIQEAKGAADGGNGRALAAALAAYRAGVRDALEEAGNDPDQLARLEAALGLHVVALETIDGAGIAGTDSAVGDALAESQKAVTEIHARSPGTHPSHAPGG